MSRTTVSVPCPPVNARISPALTATPISALTIAMTIGARLPCSQASNDARRPACWILPPALSGSMFEPALSGSMFDSRPPACAEEMTRPDVAGIAVVVSPSTDVMTVVSSDSSADSVLVCSPSDSAGAITVVASSPFLPAPSVPSLSLATNGTAFCSFSPDALSTFLYTCVATAETMEPAATPITDPAMPIFADSRNEVTAASAPAKIDENDMPLKKFFTEHDGSRLRFEKTCDSVKSLEKTWERDARHPRFVSGYSCGCSHCSVSAIAGPWL